MNLLEELRCWIERKLRKDKISRYETEWAAWALYAEPFLLTRSRLVNVLINYTLEGTLEKTRDKVNPNMTIEETRQMLLKGVREARNL